MVIPPLPISYLTPLPPVACILEGRARSHLTASRAISRLRVRVWNVSRVSSWLLPRPLFDEDNGSIRLGPLPPGNKGGAASRTDTGHFPTLQGGARRWLDASGAYWNLPPFISCTLMGDTQAPCGVFLHISTHRRSPPLRPPVTDAPYGRVDDGHDGDQGKVLGAAAGD